MRVPELEAGTRKSNIEGEIDFEIRSRWRWKMSKNRSKIGTKMVENIRKSSLGAVLEHFGEPLGAKMAQERQQERKYMKNVRL